MCYAILLQSRCKECSLVQWILTKCLMENVCDSKVSALLINKWNCVYNNTITCIYTNIFVNNYIQYYIKSTPYV